MTTLSGRSGLLLGLVVLLPSIVPASDDPARFSILPLTNPKTGEPGIGLLWTHRSRCWLVTAGHVLESSEGHALGYDEVEQAFDHPIRLEPHPYTNLGLDIIAYQVSDRPDGTGLSCLDTKADQPRLADPLDLLYFDDAGETSPLAAEVQERSKDVFLFNLRSQAVLPQGLSGAPLRTRETARLVGFTVTAEGTVGKAVRADFLELELRKHARVVSPRPLWRDPWFWASLIASAYVYEREYKSDLDRLEDQRDLLSRLPQFTAAQQLVYEAELDTFDSLHGSAEDSRDLLASAVAFSAVRGLCWLERYGWSQSRGKRGTRVDRPRFRRYFERTCQGVNPWGIF